MLLNSVRQILLLYTLNKANVGLGPLCIVCCAPHLVLFANQWLADTCYLMDFCMMSGSKAEVCFLKINKKSVFAYT